MTFTPMHPTTRPWIFFWLLVRLVDASTATAGPVQVYLLLGQSNMVGMGSVEHLRLLCNNETEMSSEYRDALWDDGTDDFVVRNDVFIKFNKDKPGNLTVGYGAKDRFGPELMAGFVLGDAHDEPVYLIKAAYGGRNLAIDFRSPAAGEGSYKGVLPSHYGWEWREMVAQIRESLDEMDTAVPGYNTTLGYEIAGIFWWQGWNDMLNWGFVNEYASNLRYFVRDLRLELDVPDMPFVVGELGMHGPNPQGKGADRVLAMRAAEKAVTLLPEFRDRSAFVPTAGYAVLNGTAYNKIYHYNGRADTYFHVGKAFGEAMITLKGKKDKVAKGFWEEAHDWWSTYPHCLRLFLHWWPSSLPSSSSDDVEPWLSLPEDESPPFSLSTASSSLSASEST